MRGSHRKRSNNRADKKYETIHKLEPDVFVEPVNNQKFGIVIDCVALNVRVRPSMDSEIITTLSAQSIVEVDLDQSVEEFYKICNAAGIEGFCAKRYIQLKD